MHGPGADDDLQPSRAGRDDARPRAGRDARRTSRPQPAGRLRAAGRRREHGRRGVPPRRRHRPRRGRRAGPARASGPAARRPWSPSSPARTPAGPGPCAVALRDAGVRRVVFAQADPNPLAAGGAALLRHAGVDVEQGLLEAEARALNEVWTFAVERGRPFVTWKFATTLDGRSAAADGTSRWVSSSGRAAGHAPAPGALRRDAGRQRHRRRSTTRSSPCATSTTSRSRSSRCAW